MSAMTDARSADPKAALDKLSAALDSGNIKQAHRLRSRFLKQPDSAYPQEIRDHFQSLSAKLKELEDWQHYATNKKRIKLCEQMERIKHLADLHPDEKAKSIRDLQQQWRQLGPSDSAEGQRLWYRFKQAGNDAFVVCAEYFDARKRRREQNLQEKNKICDSLVYYAEKNDWSSPNWKAVNDILKTARAEWKKYDDIPHQYRKRLHNRYYPALNFIESKLQEEQDRNHRLKQGYIEQVKDLIDSDQETSVIIREIKEIQLLWKQVGITSRGFDQKLWKQFREHCDAVFDRRDREKRSTAECAQQQIARAARLCEEFQETLEHKPDKEDLKRFRQAFQDCQIDRAHPLQEKFGALQDTALHLIKAAEIQTEQKIIEELERKVRICEQLENGGKAEIATGSWESGLQLPATISATISNRYQRALAGNPDYIETGLADEICVRLEMLAHIDSPESSQGTRMRLQVEKLDQQLSKGIKEERSSLEQLKDLRLQWLLKGPLKSPVEDLSRRFSRAATTIENTAIRTGE